MIKLNNLLNEETFTATNKKTGKTSVFKSKDSRDSAVKAGTHSKVADKGGDTSKKASTPTTNIFNTPAAEPKKDEPTSEPKKKRPGNPQVNKEAKKKAEQYGITPQKLGNEKYKEAMLQAAVSALTDSNFHSEARELVAAIEGKPEFAKRPEYPSIKDPKYKEKMADIRKNSADGSVYMNGTGEIDDYGTDVSQASGWDGVDAADGIAFTLRMNGFHKEADLIQSVFDNKPYMKNEGRISLTKMVNEGEPKHFNTGLSNTEDSEAEQDFNQHHATSMYGKHMGTPAEKDTIDFDDNEPNEPGVQDSDAKKKDKVDRGYEPVKKNEGTISLTKMVKEGKFKKDDLVYNKRTKTVGIVRMGDDKSGEVKTDADGNVNVDELEKYNPIKNKHQQNAKVAPSTEKEVNNRGLFNPFKSESIKLAKLVK
jgi:hypothetical protein